MKARVKMNTKAQLEEEMDLRVGDIVTVTEMVDKDWCRYVPVSGCGMFEFCIAVWIRKSQLDVTFCILYFSSTSCSTCFGQPCAHHQELTTA